MADAPEQQDIQSQDKSKSKLPFIIGAFVLLLLVIGAVSMTLLGGNEDQAIIPAEPQEELGVMYTFPQPFVVNLAFPDDQYLYNATITLQIGVRGNATEAEAQEEMGITEGDSTKNKKPIVEEIITEILSAQTRTQVTSSAGRDKIRAQIKTQLNMKLQKARIIEVYLRGLVP